ncbi:hypothetical protein LI221_16150 [Faecalimonas umbilicata]|nr:hypothetical protein [Faecalimonas umbilicata]
MILEPDFLQEVQILYKRAARLKKLQYSYTNRMDTFICNYITRHGLWDSPAAVGAIMDCLPSLYYQELITRSREVFQCEKYDLMDLARKENYQIDPELKRRLLKIFPVLRDRRDKATKEITLVWEYICDYFNEKGLFTNKEALEEIFEAVPYGYIRFRIWDAHLLKKKQEKRRSADDETGSISN